MDKLKRALGGQDDEEEAGIMAQVGDVYKYGKIPTRCEKGRIAGRH